MRRAAPFLAVFALGCEAVEIHYVGDGGSTQDHAAVSDSSPINVEEGDPIGTGGLCGCDFNQGFGCCVPSGGSSAFCTSDRSGCTQQGGIFVGCAGASNDAVCCWNGGATGGSQVGYAGSCAAGPTSCTTSTDCNGGTCKLATCGGVIVGACDVEPTCP